MFAYKHESIIISTNQNKEQLHCSALMVTTAWSHLPVVKSNKTEGVRTTCAGVRETWNKTEREYVPPVLVSEKHGTRQRGSTYHLCWYQRNMEQDREGVRTTCAGIRETWNKTEREYVPPVLVSEKHGTRQRGSTYHLCWYQRNMEQDRGSTYHLCWCQRNMEQDREGVRTTCVGIRET